MTANEIRLSLTDAQVIGLLQKLGVTKYREDDKAIIFPTICHNVEIDKASLKLYYYKDTKLFHCYTDCGDSFNIFELYKRYFEIRGIEKNFYDILSMISNDNIFSDATDFEISIYQKQARHQRKEAIVLPEYPSGVLDSFSTYYCNEWLREGITIDTMKKFNIKYSISQNKIIIPHYDINGRLVGIRGRALNPEEAANGKYKPVIVEGRMYNHPLSLNLYGLNKSKDDVNKARSIILFESEKSCMKMDSFFSINNSAAVCGSNLNKNQLMILLRNLQVNEVILAFDKEYEKIGTPECEKYLNKLREIGSKYNKYYSFSYIADRDNLLGLKDSPIDRGPEIFEYLLKKRTQIRN